MRNGNYIWTTPICSKYAQGVWDEVWGCNPKAISFWGRRVEVGKAKLPLFGKKWKLRPKTGFLMKPNPNLYLLGLMKLTKYVWKSFGSVLG